jgi:penicillin amidase
MPMPRRRLARTFVRLSSLVLAVALLLLATGWWMLQGSMPQYDGRIGSPALQAAVEVERDALGSVTVRARNRNDATWALGYVHAQERYFEMDLLRRRAAGELAELFGDGALPADRKARVHRMRARMQLALAELDRDERATIETYRDGVNAGLAALGTRPFAYLLTGNTPAPWDAVDTLLVVAAMAFTLNDAQNARELAFARMHAALPRSAWAFLTAAGGSWDAPMAGAAFEWPAPPLAMELDLRTVDPSLRRDVAAGDDGVRGSNAFAVAGTLAGGAALVADDMHLDLRAPNLWFRTRLLYPDPRVADRMVDVTGASLPGTPAIVVGSNREVAWGFTNAYADVTDWVRVTRDPDDDSRYRTTDGWQAFERHREVIRVKGQADVVLDVEETRWGPLLGEDVDGAPLALAWSAHAAGAIDIELARLELARNVDEAVAILAPRERHAIDHARLVEQPVYLDRQQHAAECRALLDEAVVASREHRVADRVAANPANAELLDQRPRDRALARTWQAHQRHDQWPVRPLLCIRRHRVPPASCVGVCPAPRFAPRGAARARALR